ncbi:hypothetical protein BV898_17239, partial [Hypsibius exemplaris]
GAPGEGSRHKTFNNIGSSGDWWSHRQASKSQPGEPRRLNRANRRERARERWGMNRPTENGRTLGPETEPTENGLTLGPEIDQTGNGRTMGPEIEPTENGLTAWGLNRANENGPERWA